MICILIFLGGLGLLGSLFLLFMLCYWAVRAYDKHYNPDDDGGKHSMFL
jgi:hypothetical protein